MAEARDGLLPVEQVDRDAAADVWPMTRDNPSRDDFLTGFRDDHSMVQAFARHRLRAAPPLPPAIAERAQRVTAAINMAMETSRSRDATIVVLVQPNGDWTVNNAEQSATLLSRMYAALPTPATGMGDAERARELLKDIARSAHTQGYFDGVEDKREDREHPDCRREGFQNWLSNEGGPLIERALAKPAPAEVAGTFNEGIEAAAKACEQQEQDFLSPQYATDQPLSSMQERFACKVCAEVIRALATREQGE